MTTPEILERLQKIFDRVFVEKVHVTPDTSAKQVAEWDSLSHISLVSSVEKEFSVRFRTGETDGLVNVGDFVALIKARSEEPPR